MQESVKDECDSVIYLYFLSVTHYLQKEYEAAIQNLNKAQEIIGMVSFIRCIRLGNDW